MAWAEKLPSGKWRGVYRDARGKRRSAGTDTHKARAERKAAALEEAARKNIAGDPDAYRRLWGDWADEWWPSRGVEATTLRADLIRRRKHLDPRWSDVALGAISRQDVRAWAAELRKGVSASTVQRIVHLFSASLNAAVDAEVLSTNPAARLKLPKSAAAQECFLTREEYGLVREQLPTATDQLVADTLVYSGMRWSELAGLHRSRVDFKRGLVLVVDTYDEGAGVMKPYPKGKRARQVPLPPDVVRRLAELPARIGTCGVEHTGGRCSSGLLFATPSGRPLRNSNWSVLWRNAVKESGVRHARIHDLRHTYASWLAQEGLPLAEIGRMLGHRSTQTTDKYAHLAAQPNEAVLAALRGTVPHESHTGAMVEAESEREGR